MHELKFRVWDTKRREFLKFVPPREYMLDCEEWSHHDMGGDEGYLTFPETVCQQNFNGRLIWQQFTGLLDRNSKEIFEGDVLVRYETNVQQELIGNSCGIPIYHNRTDLPRLPLKDIVYAKGVVEYEAPEFRLVKEGGSEKICTYDGTPYEVIGNIFENGDLLK